jgi:hypothetical protein
MAKLHGSYKAMYGIKSTQRYLMEFTGEICMEDIFREGTSQNELNSVWQDLLHAFTKEEQLATQAKKSKIKDVMMGLFKGVKEGIDTNLHLYLPLKIHHAAEMFYQAEQSKRASHRILLLRPGFELAN